MAVGEGLGVRVGEGVAVEVGSNVAVGVGEALPVQSAPGVALHAREVCFPLAQIVRVRYSIVACSVSLANIAFRVALSAVAVASL